MLQNSGGYKSIHLHLFIQLLHMRKKEPLFDEILKLNQLINGRLQVAESDLKNLYYKLQKEDSRIKNKLFRIEKNIKQHINKRNEIRSEYKRLDETILKSFYPNKNKISLLYKKQNGFFYIKARFYWSGNREKFK